MVETKVGGLGVCEGGEKVCGIEGEAEPRKKYLPSGMDLSIYCARYARRHPMPPYTPPYTPVRTVPPGGPQVRYITRALCCPGIKAAMRVLLVPAYTQSAAHMDGRHVPATGSLPGFSLCLYCVASEERLGNRLRYEVGTRSAHRLSKMAGRAGR